jgi:DNA-binding transcriptional LysR family regulator
MRLEARHLELLALVVEHGGVTVAAAVLGKSQSSVSRMLGFLEARVGQALFVAGRRPLQPTELGRELAEKGRLIVDAINEASEAAKNYRLGKSGAVRVGGTPFFMDGVVSGMLAEFQVKNTDIQIEQSYGYASDLLKKLSDDHLDLVICPLVLQQITAEFDFCALLPGRNVVACSKAHPLMMKPQITPEEIFEFPWIAPPADSPLYADLRHQLTIMGIKNFKISFSGGTIASTLAILTGSNALTILPYSVVHATSANNNIAALPIHIEHPDRTLGMVTRRGVKISPTTGKVHQFLALRFKVLAETLNSKK